MSHKLISSHRDSHSVLQATNLALLYALQLQRSVPAYLDYLSELGKPSNEDDNALVNQSLLF